MISAALLALSLNAAPLPVLTLDQAFNEARHNNLDLKVAQARLEQSLLQSRRAWAGYLPTVLVGASYTRNSAEAVFTLPPNGPTLNIQPFNQLGAQAELRQNILAPTLWATIRLAGLGQEVATLTTQNARREILFGVAQAYFSAASLQEAIRATQFLFDVNTAREKDTQARYDAGTTTRVALLRSQLDRSRAEQDLIRARNAYDSSRVALATLLQRDSADFTLQLPPVPDVPPADPELTRHAQDQRPDVLAARKNLELEAVRKQGAWLAYAPTVAFSGVYRESNAAGFTGQTGSWALTLNGSWVLWDGGLREVSLREDSARLVEAAALQRQAETRVTQEVVTARLDYDNARANLSKAQEALSLAQETQRLTDLSFKEGASTYLEVTDANASLTSAEVNAISERLQTSLAALRLQRAAGLFATQD